MPRIVARELADALSELADVRLFHEDLIRTKPVDHLFLCALGFEPRCLAVSRQLRSAQYRAHRAVYCTYDTNVEDNEANLAALEQQLGEIAEYRQMMNGDSGEFGRQLRNAVQLACSEAKTNACNVTLDISVMANRLLLRCMKILLEYDINLRIMYAEAETYHPTRREYEREGERWKSDEHLGLERGVDRVMPSVDFPGHALDPLPDCVILFPNFKRERSRAVIGAVDPSLLTNPADKVMWLLGQPHLSENRWRVEAMKRINEIELEAPQYEVSTFDYKDALNVLERLYVERAETQNITLSPLGSKMQALGAALFCHMHPDVRIILSTPRDYNAVQYSEGCRDVWCIQLGPLKEVRRRLEEVGTLFVADE